MTKEAIKAEQELARNCFIEEFGRQLAEGRITKQRHDELVSKVMSVKKGE